MTEPTVNWLKVNGVDLTPYTSSVDFTHTADEAANKAAWGEYLAGLETTTITLDNSGAKFTPLGELHIPSSKPVQITIWHPDGWWQRVKERVKGWPGFGWVKVRYRTVSFTGHLDAWHHADGWDLQGKAVGPITEGREER